MFLHRTFKLEMRQGVFGADEVMKRWLLQESAVEVITALQVEHNLPIDLYIGAHVGHGLVEVGLEYAPENEKLAQWLIEQGESSLLCGGVPTCEPPML